MELKFTSEISFWQANATLGFLAVAMSLIQTQTLSSNSSTRETAPTTTSSQPGGSCGSSISSHCTLIYMYAYRCIGVSVYRCIGVSIVDCLPSLAFLHLASPVSESFHRKILKHPTVLSMQASSLQSDHQRIHHQHQPDRKDPAIVVHPHWFEGLRSVTGSKIVEVQEWQDHNWRESDGGFHGHDFCHSSASAVRILDYILVPPSPAKEEEPAAEFPMLVGAVHFSPRAESHRGLCHGGSMCAVMDDAIGWCGFCSSVKGGDNEYLVRPWNGFTVQVNTALLKPVP
eukprot:gene9319-10120_t